MTPGLVARFTFPMKMIFLSTAILAMSACSGDEECLTQPGCGSSSSSSSSARPPTAAVLQIASFSVLESSVPGDYFCDGFCLTPFVDIVEKTGLGRAYIKSITVLGYRVLSSTAQSCPFQPGQNASLLLFEDAWLTESSLGQERTLVVTYDDGTGSLVTMSARTLVTSTVPKSANVNVDCRLGNAVPIPTPAPSLRSAAQTGASVVSLRRG